MNLERYPVKAYDNFMRFEFYSEGPKGRIRKVVQFQQYGIPHVYNLAFGDWDEVADKLYSEARSNNNDRDKVIATVASAVFEFMLVHPKAVLYAKGNTKVKTRLYQMGIGKHLSEISIRYRIRGWMGKRWVPFEKGKNYQAFILTKIT